jgi:hypothetical protein
MIRAWACAFAVVGVVGLAVTGCSGRSTPPEAATATSTAAGHHENWACADDGAQPQTVSTEGQAPSGRPETDGTESPTPDTPQAHAGGVYGDPEDATRYWEQQTESDCGLMATRLVIGDITGKPPTEKEMIDLAANTPSKCNSGERVYDESIDPADGEVGHGTCTEDLLLLLDHYGIHADFTNDDAAAGGGPATGLGALENYLGNRQHAIVCVNSRIIWNTEGDRTKCGHMVTVAAIDVDNNAVYLGDSGGDDTSGEKVTIDVFESAWKTGDHELVVTSPQ